MANIPFNPLREVMPDKRMPAPDYSPENFGAGVGRELRGVGAQASALGLKQLDLNNEAEAKDADIEYQRTLNTLGFDPESGYFGKLGKDALDDNYRSTAGAAEEAKQEILSTMKSNGARALFERAAAVHQLNFTESMSRHAIQQRKLWLVGTSDARANETMAMAAQYYNDDKRFAQAIATAKDEANQQGDLQGWSVEQKAAAGRAYESKGWVLRISRLNQDNPTAAADMFHANEGKLEPAQAVQLSATIKQTLIPVQTRQLVDNTMNGSNGVAANFADAIEYAESRGRDVGADGKPLEGPMTKFGTAKGSMQVLDATNLSPGFGVAPAADNSAEERKRVGRDYANAMLQRYGNQTAAAAAYNWGPGNVDKLIAAGFDPRNGIAGEQAFISKLPAETVDYIADVQKKAPPVPGTPPTSKDINEHLAGWMATIRESAKQMWPNDPVAQDAAVAQLVQRVSTIETGNNATERAATELMINTALGMQSIGGNITQLPFDQRPHSLAEFLKVPGVQDAWNSADGEKKRSILNLIEQTAKGNNPPVTDEAFAKYYELLGKQVNDPAGFLSTNLADPKLTALLPQQWTLTLMGTQRAMASKQERDVQKGANILQGLTIAKRTGLLADAGINPNAKEGSDDAARLNQFTGELGEAIDGYIAENKKTPDQTQMMGLVTRLLSKGYQTDSSSWVLWNERKRLFESPNPDTWRAFVPDAVKERLAAAMKAKLGRDATDQEMIDEWTVRVRAVGAKR